MLEKIFNAYTCMNMKTTCNMLMLDLERCGFVDTPNHMKLTYSKYFIFFIINEKYI